MWELELGEGQKCRDRGSGHLFWSCFLSFSFSFLVWFEEKKRQIAFGYLISVVVSFAFKI